MLNEHFLRRIDTCHGSFVFFVVEVSHADRTQAINRILLLALADDTAVGVEIGVDEDWMNPCGMINEKGLLRHFNCWVCVEDVE
jgi:hypothetical protein